MGGCSASKPKQKKQKIEKFDQKQLKVVITFGMTCGLPSQYAFAKNSILDNFPKIEVEGDIKQGCETFEIILYRKSEKGPTSPILLNQVFSREKGDGDFHEVSKEIALVNIGKYVKGGYQRQL